MAEWFCHVTCFPRFIWYFFLVETWYFYPLAVNFETTHKPSKLPTNQSNYPQTIQTTLKPAKYQTNHSLISQKSHLFFPEDIFYQPQHFPCPSCMRREIGAFLDVPARFRISPSPLHSFLPSLIADYNPSHKLLTQLRY